MKHMTLMIVLISTMGFINGCSKGVSQENTNVRKSTYRDAPTYQQWQNIEAFMIIFGTLTNGCGYGGAPLVDPYSWQERQVYGRYGYYEPWMR